MSYSTIPDSELKRIHTNVFNHLGAQSKLKIFLESKIEKLLNVIESSYDEIERIDKDLDGLIFSYELWENKFLEMEEELEFRRYNDVYITTYEEREQMGQGVLDFF